MIFRRAIDSALAKAWSIAALTWPCLSLSCGVIVDSGITYEACERDHFGEDFSPGTTLETLEERCWRSTRGESNVIVDDGDLIIRVADDAEGSQSWDFQGEGPFVFQRFDRDFLLAARIEVLNKLTGSLCLAEGSGVGLAVRQVDPELAWTTLLISPFEPDVPPEGLSCEPDAKTPFPIQATLTNLAGTWGAGIVEQGEAQHGMGFQEGEADLAACRLGTQLLFYYRDSERGWVELGDPIEVGSATVHVGLTASAGASADVEGHFTWAEYTDEVRGDGCRGELERLTLPAEE